MIGKKNCFDVLHFLTKNLPSPGASPSLVVIAFLHVLQSVYLMHKDFRRLVLDDVQVIHLVPGVVQQVPLAHLGYEVVARSSQLDELSFLWLGPLDSG